MNYLYHLLLNQIRPPERSLVYGSPMGLNKFRWQLAYGLTLAHGGCC